MKTLFSGFLLEHAFHVVQPIIDAKTNETHFFELLTRVEYGGKTYLPKDFINEMSPKMKFELAIRLFHTITSLQRIYTGLSFSLNITAFDLEMGLEDVIDKLMEQDNTRVDAKRCIIEITEQTDFEKPLIFETILSLKNKYGFRFALDDFGSGYSNLKLLLRKNSGFDYIKIDGSLVQDVCTDEAEREKLKSLVHMIQQSKKKAIVEFISNEEELKTVIETAKPDYLQGFYIGEPQPIEHFVVIPKKHCSNKVSFLSLVDEKRA